MQVQRPGPVESDEGSRRQLVLKVVSAQTELEMFAVSCSARSLVDYQTEVAG